MHLQMLLLRSAVNFRTRLQVLNIKHISLSLAALFLALVIQSPPAGASGVTMKVWPGLSGLYKMEQAVQLKVEINNSGRPIKASLVVDREEIPGMPKNEYWINYSRDLEVKSGKNNVLLVVPGELLGNPSEVRLVSGGVVLARVPIQGTNVGGGLIGLVLSEKAYRSDLFTWLDKRFGNQFTVKYIKPEELPDSALLLQGADLVVVDPEAVAALSEKQCKAVEEWTRLGGTLLLSGGAGAEKGGKFDGISPVETRGSTRVSGALGGLRPGGEYLHAAAGRVVSGRVLASGAGIPLLARRTLGRGDVVYSAVAIDELKENNDKVWAALDQPGDSSGVFAPGKVVREKYIMRDVLANASSYLPQLKLPPVPLMMLLWVIYLGIAGPGLYLVLRRYDRRDLAWVLVPGVALITAGGFYLFSPVNRLQGYLSQTLATVDVLGPGLAEVRAAGTVVMPRGGDLLLQGSPDMFVEPMRTYSGVGPKGVEVVNSHQGDRIRFNSVEYGSMRQVTAYGLWRQSGRLDGKVHFRANHIQGAITNNTNMDLRDCKLLAGGHLIELGGIKKGQTRVLDEALDKWQIVDDPNMMLKQMNPRENQSTQVRERRLMGEMVNREYWQPEGILFMGWGDNSPELFKVLEPGGQGKNYGLLLVRQNIEIQYPNGEFSLPAGIIRPSVNQISGGMQKRPDGLVLHDGKAVLKYDLKDILGERKFTVNRISFPGSNRGNTYSLEIYDLTRKKWVELNQVEPVLKGAAISRYLAPDGSIQVRITGSYRGGPASAFRGIEVEGVVEN